MGCYTQPRRGEPFREAPGCDGGVPHDATRVGAGITALWVDAASGELSRVPCKVVLEWLPRPGLAGLAGIAASGFGSGGGFGGFGSSGGQGLVNPSWLTKHPFLDVVYACCEVWSNL